MLLLKCVLLAGGIGMIVTSAVTLLSDAHRMWVLSEPVVVRRHSAGRLAAFACILILPALSIVVVPSGMAGVGGSPVAGGSGEHTPGHPSQAKLLIPLLLVQKKKIDTPQRSAF